VLFAVPVVPERDDPESPETARQIGDGVHLHAHMVNPEASAFMVFVSFDQVLERGNSRYPGTRRFAHDPTVAPAAHGEYPPLKCSPERKDKNGRNRYATNRA
jgi:hypothetical protein